MNKKGLSSDDVLELIKIGIAIIIGYIIIKALLPKEMVTNTESIKCICNCVNQTIKALPKIYAG